MPKIKIYRFCRVVCVIVACARLLNQVNDYYRIVSEIGGDKNINQPQLPPSDSWLHAKGQRILIFQFKKSERMKALASCPRILGSLCFIVSHSPVLLSILSIFNFFFFMTHNSRGINQRRTAGNKLLTNCLAYISIRCWASRVCLDFACVCLVCVQHQQCP